jgi:hypothetical protein
MWPWRNSTWTVSCDCLELLVASSLRWLVAVWAACPEDLPSKYRLAARSSFLRHGRVDLQLTLQRGRWCRGRASWSHPVHDAGSRESTRWTSRTNGARPPSTGGGRLSHNTTLALSVLTIHTRTTHYALGSSISGLAVQGERRYQGSFSCVEGDGGGPAGATRGGRREVAVGGGEDFGARNEGARQLLLDGPICNIPNV